LQAYRDDPRLVAVGEIGLDHFVPGLDRARQQAFYLAQLKLAAAAGLPVILHVRRSADALLAGLRRVPVSGGVAHAFNGSVAQAGEFLRRGFKLGFGGAMTHERALQIRRLAASLPDNALVMYRTAQDRAAGLPQGRNEPAELPRIAQVMADLRQCTPATLATVTTANACAALPRLGALVAAA
jgi:TatD DNase family protein